MCLFLKIIRLTNTSSVKVDRETGKQIPYAGAGFQIYDPNDKLVTMTYTYPNVTEIDTFYTNEDGYLITPESLPYGKGYSVVEVQAPYGYILDSTPVYFDITAENTSEENGVTIVKTEKKNTPQKGTSKGRYACRYRHHRDEWKSHKQ